LSGLPKSGQRRPGWPRADGLSKVGPSRLVPSRLALLRSARSGSPRRSTPRRSRPAPLLTRSYTRPPGSMWVLRRADPQAARARFASARPAPPISPGQVGSGRRHRGDWHPGWPGSGQRRPDWRRPGACRRSAPVSARPAPPVTIRTRRALESSAFVQPRQTGWHGVVGTSDRPRTGRRRPVPPEQVGPLSMAPASWAFSGLPQPGQRPTD
jgi:hypothetical protein